MRFELSIFETLKHIQSHALVHPRQPRRLRAVRWRELTQCRLRPIPATAAAAKVEICKRLHLAERNLNVTAIELVLTRYLAIPHTLAVVEVAIGAVGMSLAQPVRVVAIALAQCALLGSSGKSEIAATSLSCSGRPGTA